MEKVYVPVLLRVSEQGKIEPKEIEFEGKKYLIDKVLDAHPAACQSVGGVGVKYLCMVLGRQTELWEEKGLWFVVKK